MADCQYWYNCSSVSYEICLSESSPHCPVWNTALNLECSWQSILPGETYYEGAWSGCNGLVEGSAPSVAVSSVSILVDMGWMRDKVFLWTLKYWDTAHIVDPAANISIAIGRFCLFSLGIVKNKDVPVGVLVLSPPAITSSDGCYQSNTLTCICAHFLPMDICTWFYLSFDYLPMNIAIQL